MHGINGYLYANLPGLDMCVNQKISWHIIGLGDEVDIHGVNFHGQTFEMNSNRKDTVYLIPGGLLLQTSLSPFSKVWQVTYLVSSLQAHTKRSQ